MSTPAPLLYPDVEQELATTRRFLERYPDGKGSWRPHEKSMTLSHLATHLAGLAKFGTLIITSDELDFAKSGPRSNDVDSAKELLALFDSVAGPARQAITGADFATLERSWTLRSGEHVIINGPRSAVLRTLMLNHIVHHRAQLGVYYRLLGIPVPATYGRSADEG